MKSTKTMLGGWAMILLTGFHLNAEPFPPEVTLEIERFQRDFAMGDNAHRGLVIGLIDETGSRIFVCEPEGTAVGLNENTVFELGSVTKVFTALLAFELEREKTWKLSDPVEKHLAKGASIPAFEGTKTKLENLARQDSRLPWHAHGEMKTRDGKFDLKKIRESANTFEIDDLNEFLKSYQLPKKPGTEFSYSNVGIALLGCAAESASGLSFEEQIEQRIAKPLEMPSTKLRLNSDLKSRLVVGHWRSGETSENMKMKVMAPAGQLLSTVEDLLKFVAANLEITSSELMPSFHKMQKIQHSGSPRFGKTASPWFTDRIYQPPGSNLIGHGGGGFGYLAFIGMDTLKKRGVVVLSNQMVIHANGVGWAILQQYPMTPNNLSLFVKRHVGVGFSLNPAPGNSEIMVSKVFTDSPAEKAGLPKKSIIKSINGTSTAGKSIGACLKQLGGKKGDVVTLTILPPGGNSEETFEIVCGPFLTKTERKTG